MGPFCLGLKGMVPILCFGEALYHFWDHFFHSSEYTDWFLVPFIPFLLLQEQFKLVSD